MSSIRKYIIVDDDEINNIICSIAIKSVLGEVEIETFEVPEKALLFIQTEYTKTLKPTILLLDINMPTLTGWEFIEEYKKFSESIREQISIYMLSSSVDQRDRDNAEANKYVKGFMSKPLERETILSLAGL